uniref:Uncharacterized protein n=1 Tax=Kalanchoe fedtschenkoi TaxID=63787 RepID=A0A7N0T6E3_KALFE
MNQPGPATEYVSWEEVFALSERGGKEARFYLKRRDRSSDLIVIGREKSSRHTAFVYSVCDGPVMASLPDVSMLRLKSRDDVVEWLIRLSQVMMAVNQGVTQGAFLMASLCRIRMNRLSMYMLCAPI